jgi:hypothetical protein
MAHEEEDDGVLKPRKMEMDAEFMQHPDSGSFIRNPLKHAKCKSTPILLSASEFNHNMLEDTLGEWHCISVSEDGFRNMMQRFADTHGTTLPSNWSRSLTNLSRCSVGHVHSLGDGFKFDVQIRKSTYVVPRKKAPRPGDRKDAAGVTIDKVNMELSDVDGKSLRVENITEGLVSAWNRMHPTFPVKIGDCVVRVNDKKGNSSAMLEEMQTSSDLLRITFHRAGDDRRRNSNSKDPNARSSTFDEGTILPGQAGLEFSAGSLANPDKKAPPRKKTMEGAH